jgi:hypothetical protein
MLDNILKYDLFFNFEPINDNINYIKEYTKFNDKIGYDELATLKVRLYRFHKEKKINALYYESFIEQWYKEWFLKQNENKSKKYKKKTKKLNLMLKNLMKIFRANNI